jgi:hypothetical protein
MAFQEDLPFALRGGLSRWDIRLKVLRDAKVMQSDHQA